MPDKPVAEDGSGSRGQYIDDGVVPRMRQRYGEANGTGFGPAQNSPPRGTKKAREEGSPGSARPAVPLYGGLSLPVLHADTAGIDIGATEIYVAVPADRDEEPVRCFEAYTGDLRGIAEWLGKCEVKRVAMESTGVYWIPLWQILADAGFEVCLVNARHFKNVPGRPGLKLITSSEDEFFGRRGEARRKRFS